MRMKTTVSHAIRLSLAARRLPAAPTYYANRSLLPHKPYCTPALRDTVDSKRACIRQPVGVREACGAIPSARLHQAAAPQTRYCSRLPAHKRTKQRQTIMAQQVVVRIVVCNLFSPQ